MMLRFSIIFGLVALLAVLNAPYSHAIPLLTSSSFSSTGVLVNGGSSSTPDVFHLDLFDSSLGTLDSVSLHISGTTSLVGTTETNLSYSSGTPISYPVTTYIYHSFFGQGGEFFTLDDLTPYYVTLTADGAGSLIEYAHFFNYTFTFDASTDLAGGGLVGPPGSQINGTRDDFLLDAFSLETMQFHFTGGVDSILPQFLNVTSNGSVIVQYDYTPHAPAPVPEPSTILLLGSGLIGLGWYGRKRKKA